MCPPGHYVRFESHGLLYREHVHVLDSFSAEDGLWIGDGKITIEGMAKTCDPIWGNGIEFLKMSDGNRERLREYLNALNQVGVEEETAKAEHEP
jgi:hypothetical protein